MVAALVRGKGMSEDVTEETVMTELKEFRETGVDTEEGDNHQIQPKRQAVAGLLDGFVN